MPRLNHANLAVAEVPPLRDFLVRHFGFRALPAPGPDAFAVLTDDAGFVLSLMRLRAGEGSGYAAGPYPGTFHVGFYLDTPDAVHAKRAELAAAGCEVGDVDAVRRGGFESTTCYCRAPGGVVIEISSPHPAPAPVA